MVFKTCKNKCRFAKVCKTGDFLQDAGQDVLCFNEKAIQQFAKEEEWLIANPKNKEKWLKEFNKEYPYIKKEGFSIFDVAELAGDQFPRRRNCKFYEKKPSKRKNNNIPVCQECEKEVTKAEIKKGISSCCNVEIFKRKDLDQLNP